MPRLPVIGSSRTIMRQTQAPRAAPVDTADADLVRRALGRDEAAVRAIMP
jgi:RNA polymerase sigma-70 factor (ECF subfamily)